MTILDHSEIIQRIVNELGLSSSIIYPSVGELARFYSNLMAMVGGDKESAHHWVVTGNRHLGYTPYLRLHLPVYLEEMNQYLEAILNH